MTNKEHALHYAEAGLKVFPVWNKSKIPHTPQGFFDATINPQIISDWWDLYPNAGIGIRIPDDIVIVDYDGDAKACADNMRDQGWLLPLTLWATTGSGGRHYWYRMPESHRGMQKRSIKFLVGANHHVDLLTNGFVVAPPSESTHGKYKWHGAFDINAISDAPDWLLHSYAAEHKWKDKIDPDEVLEGVEEGGRNTTIFRYGCRLRDSGLTYKEAQVLLDAAAANCQPPMNKGEIKGMAKRIWKTYDDKKEADAGMPKIYSLAELDSLALPPPKFFVYDIKPDGTANGLIPAGVTVLTSAPKVGKSALIGRITGAIAEEERVMGFETSRSGILYLDLQQSEIFARDRWRKVLDYRPSNLYTAFSWDPMDKGGMDHIRQFLGDKPEVGMVVIDTLAEFWPIDDTGSGSVYRAEARVMKTFRKLADDFGLAVVLIHHETKSSENNTGNMVKRAGGTYGLTGGADAVMSLTREDGSEEGMLAVTGKNIPARLIPLRYDIDTLRWEKR